MSFGETKTSSQYTRYITENAVSPTVWDTNVDADELYKKIPNVGRGICQLTVETYNGSTLIGSKTISFLLLVTDADPVLPDFEFEDINEEIRKQKEEELKKQEEIKQKELEAKEQKRLKKEAKENESELSKSVKKMAGSFMTSIGRQLGNAIIRGILGTKK